MAKSGIDESLLKEQQPVVEATKKALPERAAYIDQHGSGALVHLLDDMEEAILTEMAKSLIISDLDRAGVDQASQILKLTAEAASTLRPKVDAPDGLSV